MTRHSTKRKRLKVEADYEKKDGPYEKGRRNGSIESKGGPSEMTEDNLNKSRMIIRKFFLRFEGDSIITIPDTQKVTPFFRI